jgi:hypothetical protein
VRFRRLLAVAVIAPLALAAGCQTTITCKNCKDIVTAVPWSVPETHTYTLTQSGSAKGTVVLSVEASGNGFVLSQKSSDDKGNSDESAVTVDGATLKPVSSTRTIIDSSERNVAESTYEDIATSTCSSGRIVQIKQSTYKPPNADKPTTRSAPMCVPDHAYDNDASLFTWRAIKFDNFESMSYVTVLADRRNTQIVNLLVHGEEQITTASGSVDSWRVDIDSPSGPQHAWFATTPDHRLLRYDNGTSVFEIQS